MEIDYHNYHYGYVIISPQVSVFQFQMSDDNCDPILLWMISKITTTNMVLFYPKKST